MELGAAHAHGMAERLDPEVGIAQVGRDHFPRSFQKNLVRRNNRFRSPSRIQGFAGKPFRQEPPLFEQVG